MTLQARALKTSELSKDNLNSSPALAVIDADKLGAGTDLLSDQSSLSVLKDTLVENGAVLIRNWPLHSIEDANKLLENLDVQFETYLAGASPRTRLTKNFYTSTEIPKLFVVPFHTEMCYVQRRPRKLFFYCDAPPERAGETPIFDAAAIFENLPPEIQDKVENLGVIYQRYFVNKEARFLNVYKTWMDSLQAETREEAEQTCRRQGLEFEWQEDGGLITRNALPACVIEPTTGRKCLNLTLQNAYATPHDMYKFKHRFNPVLRLALAGLVKSQFTRKKVFLKTLWGDGSEISEAETQAIIDTAWKYSTLFTWQQGDMVLIDNIRCGHGRLNVKKPRKIVAALGDFYNVNRSKTVAQLEGSNSLKAAPA